MRVAEQRHRAVLAVISDGRTVTESLLRCGVSRQTMHAWLGKYEAGGGLEGLGDAHRPQGCPASASGGDRGGGVEAPGTSVAGSAADRGGDQQGLGGGSVTSRRCIDARAAGPGWSSRTDAAAAAGTGNGGGKRRNVIRVRKA